MDRRLSGLPAAGMLALLLACSGSPPRAGTGSPLPAGRRPTGPATGVAVHRDLGSGVLSYAVAFAGGDLVAVELAEQFELVVRDGGGAERRRIALGPPEWDVNRLVVDGGTAWVASLDGTVRAYELASGRQLHRWHLGAGATAVTARAGWIATGSATGVVCLRRAGDGALLQCVAAHRDRVSALDLDRAGARLVSAAADGSAIIWELPSLRMAARRSGRQPLQDAAFAADGRVALADGAEITLWAGTAEQRCRGHRTAVTAVAWLPDRVGLLSGSQDRTVRLWRSAPGGCVEVAQLGGFVHQVRGLAVAAGGRLAAVAAWAPDLRSRATAVLAFLYGGRR